MKKTNSKQALDVAYENLYNSKIKHIDRHLDNLLSAKKIISQERNRKNKICKPQNER